MGFGAAAGRPAGHWGLPGAREGLRDRRVGGSSGALAGRASHEKRGREMDRRKVEGQKMSTGRRINEEEPPRSHSTRPATMFQCRAVLSKCKTSCVRFNSSSSSSSSGIPKLATTPNKFNAKSSAFNLRPDLPEGLFYHPAPAAPSPEITPKAFLPKSDARAASSLYYPEQDVLVTANVDYMPVISRASQPKNYKFDASVVEQLQALRDQGVSRKQIKEEFNVTDHFISLVTKANPQTQKQQKKLLKKSARKWSVKTLKARTLKEVKKLQWERDL